MALAKEFSLKENITKEKAMRNIERGMESEDAMTIDPEIIPPGMEYARADINRTSKLRSLQNKGWTFVPASRHPELAFRGIENQDPRTADLILFGKDLVLMERSIELCEMERRLRDRDNYQRMIETPGLQGTPYEANNQSIMQAGFGKGEGREASFA